MIEGKRGKWDWTYRKKGGEGGEEKCRWGKGGGRHFVKEEKERGGNSLLRYDVIWEKERESPLSKEKRGRRRY